MLTVQSQKIIEDQLLKSGAVTADQLGTLKLQAVQSGKPLLSFVAEKKLIDDELMTKILAQAANKPYVALSSANVDPNVLKTISLETARNYMAVPFGNMKGKLAVAMLDASNIQAVNALSKQTAKPLEIFMASRGSIEQILKQYPVTPLPQAPQTPQSVLAAQEAIAEATAASGGLMPESHDLQTVVEDAPITKALNAVLDYAISARASDVHIEPREKDLKIRCRIDGILQETMSLPKTLEPALVSRVKILSNLKIDEHRVPQDGQFQFKSAGREIDARVAVSPVAEGEQVVIRLLDKTSSAIDLNSLGIRGRSYDVLKEGIKKPYGMILSTGPTGSGKSTTLYAVIKELNDDTVNIVTLEDPIEYRIDGINQIQVNNAVGLTFASGLRSILRQDPNVIMVGEIRDKETADLGVQAALTGHIVLSSLHTNSAAGVLPRMLDMAVEPFLLASTINTVIGQRLVRKICQDCKKPLEANEAQVASIKKTLEPVLPKDKETQGSASKKLGYDSLPLGAQNAYTLYKADGCKNCVNGFRGRIGIFEVIGMNSAIEQLLVRHATTSEIHAQAVKDGMITMKQDGYLKALAGITTLEEVARVAADM